MDLILQNKTILESLISEFQSVGVVVTDRQNTDALAAALSLHLILQDSGKNSQVISRIDPTVEYSSLVGIDSLKKNFGGITKLLTVSFPYNDGDIEKVSYNIEGNRLNVNLFAEEQGIKFSEKDITFNKQGSSPQLVFTIGIENANELTGFTQASTKIVNIDNSVTNALFGDLVLVDSAYSSLSEIIARMALDLNLQVEFDVAQNLLDGITSVTNNFSSPKTSPTAFEMAGILMQKGAVRRNVNGGVQAQITDTSLNMLGNKPQNKQFREKPFGQKQPKPFNQPRPVQNQPNPPAGGQIRSNEPAQPRPVEDVTPAAQSDTNSNSNIPTEDEAPSDWFTPKVFKSNKN